MKKRHKNQKSDVPYDKTTPPMTAAERKKLDKNVQPYVPAGDRLRETWAPLRSINHRREEAFRTIIPEAQDDIRSEEE